HQRRTGVHRFAAVHRECHRYAGVDHGLGDDGRRAGVQADGRANGDGLFGHDFDLLVGVLGSGQGYAAAKAALASSSALGLMNCLAAITAIAPTTVPTARETTNHSRLPMAKNTKMPPCGALRVT